MTSAASSLVWTRNEKGVHLLAKTLYRQLRESGYPSVEIVALATELLGRVSRDIAARRAAADGADALPPSDAAPHRP